MEFFADKFCSVHLSDETVEMEISGAVEVSCKKSFQVVRDCMKKLITIDFYRRHKLQLDMFTRSISAVIFVASELEMESIADDDEPGSSISEEELMLDPALREGWFLLLRKFDESFTCNVYESIRKLKYEGVLSNDPTDFSDLKFALLCRAEDRLTLSLDKAKQYKGQVETLKGQLVDVNAQLATYKDLVEKPRDLFAGKCDHLDVSKFFDF